MRSRQASWHKDVKDGVFANEEYITVNIEDKAMDMKKQWKNTTPPTSILKYIDQLPKV